MDVVVSSGALTDNSGLHSAELYVMSAWDVFSWKNVSAGIISAWDLGYARHTRAAVTG